MKLRSCLTLVILLFVFSFSAKGKEQNYEFGRISQEEFDMKIYPKDKNAEAVVLFDMGKSYFIESETGFKIVYERTTRIKILTSAGIKWGKIHIPYYQQGSTYEEIVDLEGNTYNPDEATYVKKSILNTQNSFIEKINNNWKMKKFALPDVKVGSIIEYRYKIYSDYVFNLRNWEFQWEIPVMYSQYTVKMIPFYEYIFILQGTNKFDSQESYIELGIENSFASIKYKNYVHSYVMKDLPAFND